MKKTKKIFRVDATHKTCHNFTMKRQKSPLLQPIFHIRPLCVAAIGLLLGVLCYRFVPVLLLPFGAAAAGIVCLCLLVLKKRVAALLFAGLSLGMARIFFAVPTLPAPGNYVIAGRVCQTPAASEDGWALTLSDVTLDGVPMDGQLLLTVKTQDVPSYAAALTCRAAVRQSETGYRERLLSQGITATAVGATGTLRVQDGSSKTDAYGLLLDLREAVGAHIDALFPASGGLVRGLLLGDKTELDETFYQHAGALGMAHLFAVSGLHVTTLAGAVYLLLRDRARWRSFFVLAGFIVLYAAITAFSPSVVRAGIMLLYAALAAPLWKKPDMPTALSVAFCTIVLCNPFSLFTASFQLSFGAVYGLILLSPVLQSGMRRIANPVRSLLAASVAVNFATLPVVSRLFSDVPLTSVVGNLFVLPLFPLFLIPAFVVTALSFVLPGAAGTLAIVPRFVLDVLCAVIDAGAVFRLAVPKASAISCLLFFAAMPLCSRLYLGDRKKGLAAAAAVFAAALVLWRI